jgi:hypothetical protein
LAFFFPFFGGLNLAQESNNETKLFKRTKDQNHEKTLLNTSASFLIRQAEAFEKFTSQLHIMVKC